MVIGGYFLVQKVVVMAICLNSKNEWKRNCTVSSEVSTEATD